MGDGQCMRRVASRRVCVCGLVVRLELGWFGWRQRRRRRDGLCSDSRERRTGLDGLPNGVLHDMESLRANFLGHLHPLHHERTNACS
jgi:hypothetical protein